MPRDVKYGKVEAERGNFPDPDEPVFVMRAQDVLALPILKHYRAQAHDMECPDEFLKLLDEVVEKFTAWSGTRKRPD